MCCSGLCFCFTTKCDGDFTIVDDNMNKKRAENAMRLYNKTKKHLTINMKNGTKSIKCGSNVKARTHMYANRS